MAGPGNAPPVIIKRKKVVAAQAHHGGAWKVAYADFVTAMMAFFLLMWLLNATTENQRKGLSDYFNPTIPINRISGGGEGALMGDSLFAQEARVHNGSGGTSNDRGSSSGQKVDTMADEAQKELQEIIEKELFDRGGESRTMEQLLRHVITRITDEGLVIEMFDLENAALFQGDTAVLTENTQLIVKMVAQAVNLAENSIAVTGHIRKLPVTLAHNPSWELSAARAQAIRHSLQGAEVHSDRMRRISGYADRVAAVADPGAIRNNRIEIILLRSDR